MHPSLLPRHRGAAPIYHTLLKDDKVGGISVIELHKSKFDAGKVFYIFIFTSSTPSSLMVILFSTAALPRKDLHFR